MAILHDRDHDVSDYRDRSRIDHEDREISLGTGTILGIFFGLALLCAIFFGFGYSMGRKSVQTAVAAATPAPSSSTGGIFNSFKPAAGNPGTPVHAAATTATEPPIASAPAHDPDGDIVTAPVTTPEDTSTATKSVASPPRPVTPKSTPDPSPAATTTLPTATPTGTTMVQVAAVSHQEDADTLIAALKKKGYAVFVRNESQDHLLHVQLGPFATRKDADTMRQHLLADGYNAIVK